MWRVFLFEFIVVVIISIFWAHILSKENNNFDEKFDDYDN
jgi:hypothetical protein